MSKSLSEITKSDWILWNWVDVTTFGDFERMFEIGYKRTPDEIIKAAAEWDASEKIKKSLV